MSEVEDPATPPTPAAPPADWDPSAWVPKSRFNEVNTLFKEAAAQRATLQREVETANGSHGTTVAELQAKLAGYEGWQSPTEVETAIVTARDAGASSASQMVALADAGVAPAYRKYVASELADAKPEDPAAWLTTFKEGNTGFFATPAAALAPETPPVGTPPATPAPTTTPTQTTPQPTPPPGRDVDLSTMTVKDYMANRSDVLKAAGWREDGQPGPVQ